MPTPWGVAAEGGWMADMTTRAAIGTDSPESKPQRSCGVRTAVPDALPARRACHSSKSRFLLPPIPSPSELLDPLLLLLLLDDDDDEEPFSSLDASAKAVRSSDVETARRSASA